MLEIDLGANVIFLKRLDVVRSGGVEVVDIGLVMFGMMDLHNLAGDVRFQRLQSGVSHKDSLSPASQTPKTLIKLLKLRKIIPVDRTIEYDHSNQLPQGLENKPSLMEPSERPLILLQDPILK